MLYMLVAVKVQCGNCGHTYSEYGDITDDEKAVNINAKCPLCGYDNSGLAWVIQDELKDRN